MPSKFSYESMGTKWEVFLWDQFKDEKIERLKDEIIKKSKEFDYTYSRFKKDSLVWKIADNGAGEYEVPDDFINMLKLYIDLYEASNKKLNPLIGFSISDLGYDHIYSLTPKETIREVPDLLETVKITSPNTIFVSEPVLFDFGALGKGYFVDKIAKYLKGEGIERFLVNGSGDIYYYDGFDKLTTSKSIPVGLEDPEDPNKVIGKVDMGTGAMCASGINRRKWLNHNHVIDPHTLDSQQEIIATWVTASSCAIADALATCLFFSPPENFKNYSFEYLIMNNMRQVKKSDELNVELY